MLGTIEKEYFIFRFYTYAFKSESRLAGVDLDNIHAGAKYTEQILTARAHANVAATELGLFYLVYRQA